MEQKIKFIIIGLIAILAVSLFASFQSYSAKQTMEREKDLLQKENASLTKKIEESRQDTQRLEDKVNVLNKELDSVSKEKEEIQHKYDLIGKEKAELIEQLRAVKSRRTESAVPAVPALPVSDEAYWGGVLKVKTDLEMQLESIRNELRTAQINSEQLQREKSTLELDVNNLARENQDLKRQFEYNQKIMDSIASELVIEKNDKFQIESSLKTLTNENGLLRRQIKSLTNRKINLERRLAELQKENSRLAGIYTEMDTLLKDSMSQIDNLKKRVEIGQVEEGEVSVEGKDAVELPPIIVRPQAETAIGETTPLAAKILAVNKDNNFVIIDLGQEQGIKVGDVLQVYREGRRLADIEVIRISKTVAACDIKKETTPIKIGDIVR